MIHKKLLILLLLVQVISVLAEPQPGDVFREFSAFRRNPFGWMIGHDTNPETALEIPGTVNKSEVAKVELEVQKSSVDGNGDVSIKLNSGPWHTLPLIPTLNNQMYKYVHHHFPILDIPLGEIIDGTNSFYLKSSGNSMVYGVTLRLYLKDGIDHPTGSITTLSDNDELGQEVTLESADATSPNGTITRADYICWREDVNHRGDGIYQSWHSHFNRNIFVSNCTFHPESRFATASAPYRAVWNTQWVPEQSQNMKMAVKLTDSEGISYISEAVTGLTFKRPGLKVELCKPYDLPEDWLVRNGAKSNKFDITGDRSQIKAAQMVVSTWNGRDNRGVTVNGQEVSSSMNFQGGHNYGFNRNKIEPLSLLSKATGNTIGFKGGAHPGEHGAEINYPGCMVVIQYHDPSTGLRTGDNSTRQNLQLRVMRAGQQPVVNLLGAAGQIPTQRNAGSRMPAPGIYLRYRHDGTAQQRVIPVK